jgi:hypothetical protein
MASKFKKMVTALEAKGMSKAEAGGVAYKAGVAKYGKKKMAAKAAAGRRAAAKTKGK